MRDEDKPFVCFKRGWAIQIVPRNGAGWRATGLWMIPFLALIALFIWGCAAMETRGLESRIGLVLVPPLLVATGVWAVAMIRWMKARSEIVDIDKELNVRRKRGSRA